MSEPSLEQKIFVFDLCTKMSRGLKPRPLGRHFRHAKNAAIAGSRRNPDF